MWYGKIWLLLVRSYRACKYWGQDVIPPTHNHGPPEFYSWKPRGFMDLRFKKKPWYSVIYLKMLSSRWCRQAGIHAPRETDNIWSEGSDLKTLATISCFLYLWSSSGVLLISSENSKRGVLLVKSAASNLTDVRTGLSLVKFVVFKISGLAEVTLPLLGWLR